MLVTEMNVEKRFTKLEKKLTAITVAMKENTPDLVYDQFYQNGNASMSP